MKLAKTLLTGVLLTLLVTAPALAQTTPPDTQITSFSGGSQITNDPSPTFTFEETFHYPATFECSLDGGPFEPCTSPKTYILLSDGEHTFAVRAIDEAGNVDPTPATLTWTQDTTEPRSFFTSTPGAHTNDRTPSWSWTVQDANPRPPEHCRLRNLDTDQIIVDRTECSGTFTVPGELPDGNYELRVEEYDRAGNGEFEYSTTEVDTVAPTIVSYYPTGKRVRPTIEGIKVEFSDSKIYGAQYVSLYRKGSTTPVAVSREQNYGTTFLWLKRPLKRDTWYVVRVGTGVNDGANNLAAPFSWKFKTRP